MLLTRWKAPAALLFWGTLGLWGTAVARADAGKLTAIALPGATADGVGMDYIAYDHARHQLWVPAGNTGRVDVIGADQKVRSVDGFATKEMERNGKKRLMGPSSVAIAGGLAYVGNRGDSAICAVDASSLVRGACLALGAMPDGLVWVASAKELWVTTPRNQSIVILDASKPAQLSVKATLKLDGGPEGFAVDDGRGLVYTNFEDTDRTVAIDVKTRRVVTNWPAGCGKEGPRGVALDAKHRWLFVACTDRVRAIDAAHQGQELSTLTAGAGVDNLDYVEADRRLYVAAGGAGQLTVAAVDDKGTLTSRSVTPTAPGARNGVAGDSDAAFVTDSRNGKILLISGAIK